MQTHKRLLLLAFPLIIANVTTPLLGLVDTAILGRMEDVSILAGAAIGSMIITQLYWVCGFLKMSITGLSAQSLAKEQIQKLKLLVQGIGLALALSIILFVFQTPILAAGMYLADAQSSVISNAQAYFHTRIFGAPAALINMVLIGWLVGQQKTKSVLYLQLIINITNICASLVFVYVFDLGVEGVAAATVFAEYLMLAIGLRLTYRFLVGQSKSKTLQTGQSKFQLLHSWFSWQNLKNLLSLNKHMFVRNLALQFTLAFVTLKGSHYGVLAVAANAILLQFFSLIALGLDGIANAVEALVGEAKGNRSLSKMHTQVKVGLIWSSIFALIYSTGFYFLDSLIINLLTHHEEVLRHMESYSYVIILLPLIAHWCFLFDGVFVGLSLGKLMQNTMLVSTVGGFLPIWFLFNSYGNIALWWAMLSFLFFRGLLLGYAYLYYAKNKRSYLIN